MQTYTIPYTYRSAIDIHNDNDADHTVAVRFYNHPDGKEARRIERMIPAKSSVIILTSDFPYSASGRNIVRIYGPDNLGITEVHPGEFQMTRILADK